MTSEYAREYSRYPDRVMELIPYRDIDDSVSAIISEIYQFQAAGDYRSANALIEQNKELLKPYSIDMSALRRISEELYNTQLYAKKTSQHIYVSETEPSGQLDENDQWLQEY